MPLVATWRAERVAPVISRISSTKTWARVPTVTGSAEAIIRESIQTIWPPPCESLLVSIIFLDQAPISLARTRTASNQLSSTLEPLLKVQHLSKSTKSCATTSWYSHKPTEGWPSMWLNLNHQALKLALCNPTLVAWYSSSSAASKQNKNLKKINKCKLGRSQPSTRRRILPAA